MAIWEARPASPFGATFDDRAYRKPPAWPGRRKQVFGGEGQINEVFVDAYLGRVEACTRTGRSILDAQSVTPARALARTGALVDNQSDAQAIYNLRFRGERCSGEVDAYVAGRGVSEVRSIGAKYDDEPGG